MNTCAEALTRAEGKASTRRGPNIATGDGATHAE